MHQPSFLPSEVARLVLGYLRDEGCKKAYKALLNESAHLGEYRQLLTEGLEFPTKVAGKELKDMLDEYGHIKILEINRETTDSNEIWNWIDALLTEQRRAPQLSEPKPRGGGHRGGGHRGRGGRGVGGARGRGTVKTRGGARNWGCSSVQTRRGGATTQDCGSSSRRTMINHGKQHSYRDALEASNTSRIQDRSMDLDVDCDVLSDPMSSPSSSLLSFPSPRSLKLSFPQSAKARRASPRHSKRTKMDTSPVVSDRASPETSPISAEHVPETRSTTTTTSCSAGGSARSKQQHPRMPPDFDVDAYVDHLVKSKADKISPESYEKFSQPRTRFPKNAHLDRNLVLTALTTGISQSDKLLRLSNLSRPEMPPGDQSADETMGTTPPDTLPDRTAEDDELEGTGGSGEVDEKNREEEQEEVADSIPMETQASESDVTIAGEAAGPRESSADDPAHRTSDVGGNSSMSLKATPKKAVPGSSHGTPMKAATIFEVFQTPPNEARAPGFSELFQTPVKQQLMESKGVSPRRKCHAPKRRSVGEVIKVPEVSPMTCSVQAAVSPEIKQNQDSNDSSGSSAHSSNILPMKLNELDEFLHSTGLAAKLATQINSVHLAKTPTDNNTQQAHGSEQPRLDAGGAVAEAGDSGHESSEVHHRPLVGACNIDAILEDSQMSETGINTIINMTQKDPDFDALFSLFNVDKNAYIESEYGGIHTAATTDNMPSVRDSPAIDLTNHSQEMSLAGANMETGFANHSQETSLAGANMETGFANHSQETSLAGANMETSFANHSQETSLAGANMETGFANHSQETSLAGANMETGFANHSQETSVADANVETTFANHSHETSMAGATVETTFANHSQETSVAGANMETTLVNHSQETSTADVSLETSLAEASMESTLADHSLEMTEDEDRPEGLPPTSVGCQIGALGCLSQERCNPASPLSSLPRTPGFNPASPLVSVGTPPPLPPPPRPLALCHAPSATVGDSPDRVYSHCPSGDLSNSTHHSELSSDNYVQIIHLTDNDTEGYIQTAKLLSLDCRPMSQSTAATHLNSEHSDELVAENRAGGAQATTNDGHDLAAAASELSFVGAVGGSQQQSLVCLEEDHSVASPSLLRQAAHSSGVQLLLASELSCVPAVDGFSEPPAASVGDPHHYEPPEECGGEETDLDTEEDGTKDGEHDIQDLQPPAMPMQDAQSVLRALTTMMTSTPSSPLNSTALLSLMGTPSPLQQSNGVQGNLAAVLGSAFQNLATAQLLQLLQLQGQGQNSFGSGQAVDPLALLAGILSKPSSPSKVRNPPPEEVDDSAGSVSTARRRRQSSKSTRRSGRASQGSDRGQRSKRNVAPSKSAHSEGSGDVPKSDISGQSKAVGKQGAAKQPRLLDLDYICGARKEVFGRSGDGSTNKRQHLGVPPKRGQTGSSVASPAVVSESASLLMPHTGHALGAACRKDDKGPVPGRNKRKKSTGATAANAVVDSAIVRDETESSQAAFSAPNASTLSHSDCSLIFPHVSSFSTEPDTVSRGMSEPVSTSTPQGPRTNPVPPRDFAGASGHAAVTTPVQSAARHPGATTPGSSALALSMPSDLDMLFTQHQHVTVTNPQQIPAPQIGDQCSSPPQGHGTSQSTCQADNEHLTTVPLNASGPLSGAESSHPSHSVAVSPRRSRDTEVAETLIFMANTPVKEKPVDSVIASPPEYRLPGCPPGAADHGAIPADEGCRFSSLNGVDNHLDTRGILLDLPQDPRDDDFYTVIHTEQNSSSVLDDPRTSHQQVRVHTPSHVGPSETTTTTTSGSPATRPRGECASPSVMRQHSPGRSQPLPAAVTSSAQPKAQTSTGRGDSLGGMDAAHPLPVARTSLGSVSDVGATNASRGTPAEAKRPSHECRTDRGLQLRKRKRDSNETSQKDISIVKQTKRPKKKSSEANEEKHLVAAAAQTKPAQGESGKALPDEVILSHLNRLHSTGVLTKFVKALPKHQQPHDERHKRVSSNSRTSRLVQEMDTHKLLSAALMDWYKKDGLLTSSVRLEKTCHFVAQKYLDYKKRDSGHLAANGTLRKAAEAMPRAAKSTPGASWGTGNSDSMETSTETSTEADSGTGNSYSRRTPTGTATEADRGTGNSNSRRTPTGTATEADRGTGNSNSRRTPTGTATEADRGTGNSNSRRTPTETSTEADRGTDQHSNSRRTPTGTATEADRGTGNSNSRSTPTGTATEADRGTDNSNSRRTPTGTSTEADRGTDNSNSRRTPTGTATEADSGTGNSNSRRTPTGTSTEADADTAKESEANNNLNQSATNKPTTGLPLGHLKIQKSIATMDIDKFLSRLHPRKS